MIRSPTDFDKFPFLTPKKIFLKYLFSGGVPGWPSLIETTVIVSKVVYAPLDTSAYGNPWTYRMAKAQALDWRPYVINPRILSEAYATDAFKEIVYECVFCKRLIDKMCKNSKI